MTTFYTDSMRKKRDITLMVAICGVMRALRPVMHHPLVPFVAAVRVPELENLFLYRRAATYLLKLSAVPHLEGYREESNVSVESYSDFADPACLSRAEDIKFQERTIVLYSGDADIPADIAFASDFVTQIEKPTAAHWQAAARMMRMSGMTKEAAAFLCTCKLHDAKLALRGGRPLSNGIRRLKAADAKRAGVVQEAPKPNLMASERRLDDAVGYGEAKHWGLQVARDLKDWKAGVIDWREVDRGALVSGPPGCGKTTYAQLLANSCDAALVTASAAKWQAKGHLGDFLAAMRASFAEAKKKAPAILFIDEFDSIGDRDVPDYSNHDYKRQVVNGLLEALDGAEDHKGVVVVGATNYPQAIDAGLLRPGRLETHLVIPPLDGKQRVAVMGGHLGIGDLEQVEEAFVPATKGWTGADIAKLAREVRRRARLDRRAVTVDDVVASLPSPKPVPTAMLKRVAVHEIGHAIVGVLVGADLVAVELSDTVYGDGGLRSGGHCHFTETPLALRTRSDFLDRVAILMAGIAAEQLVFGEHSEGAGGDPRSDLALATNLATMLETNWGMGGTMVSEVGQEAARLEMLRARDPKMRARVDATIKAELDRAGRILKETHAHLTAPCDRLVDEKALVGADVVALLGRMAGGVSTGVPTNRRDPSGN